jgi:hypothetical protein
LGQLASAFRCRRIRFLAATVLRFQCLECEEGNEKLQYMHENPVKRKLVLRAGDWPWSSCSHYAKRERGLIQIDALEEKRTPRENLHP